jgi:hypothetical protein
LHGEIVIAVLTRLLFAIYFVETGLLLVIGPWTAWWRQNVVIELVPWIAPVMTSPITRAGVVVLGVVTVLAGLNDFRTLVLGRLARRRRDPGYSSDTE